MENIRGLNLHFRSVTPQHSGSAILVNANKRFTTPTPEIEPEKVLIAEGSENGKQTSLRMRQCQGNWETTSKNLFTGKSEGQELAPHPAQLLATSLRIFGARMNPPM
jgi:hypothetical protein